jgi:alanine racemase
MVRREGVDHFAVFDSREAWRVRRCAGRGVGVMVMGMIAVDELEWATAEDVELYVYDLDRLEAAVAAAGRTGHPARIHLEVETGLNRTGLEEGELDAAAETIRAAGARVVVEGLCTHFAGAESITNYARIQSQIGIFRERTRQLRELGVEPRTRHAASSAATLAYPDTRYDRVRVGILQYGFWPSEETRIHHLRSGGAVGEDPLRRVISWRTRVMELKSVSTGEFVGYGTTFIAPRPTVIATVPVGYSHGYARSLSNQGQALVRGRRVGVVGIVNMNVTMLDVTNVPGVEVGDEVVLIGRQRRMAIPVSSFSELSNQLNYELLTRLPGDIPRRVVA